MKAMRAAVLVCLYTFGCGDEEGSGTGTDTTPPVVELTSPTTSDTATYELTGTATDDVAVVALAYSLNQAPEAAIPPASPFSVELTLVEGANNVRVTALDAVGNQGVTNLTVTATLNRPPVANGETITLNEDVETDIELTGSDPDGDTPSFAIVDEPAHGTLEGSAPNLTYVPDPDFAGDDAFTFEVSDGALTSEPATIALEIGPVDDPPSAESQAATTDEDAALDLTLAGTDPDGDTLLFAIVEAPEHGTLDTTDLPAVTYTPDANYYGDDTFRFSVDDGLSTSAADVSIEVTSINDAPVAMGPAEDPTTAEDTPVDIALGGEDVEGDALTFRITVDPAHGALDTIDLPVVAYRPDGDYSGTDAFTFVANDGTADSEPVVVTLTVTSVPDAPNALPQALNAREDTPLAISLQATDVDTSPGDLVFTITDGPDHGTLDDSELPDVLYTPNANYSGSDTFTFRVADGPRTDTATVTLNIGEGTIFFLAVDGSNANSGLYADEPKATLGFENGAMVLVDPDGNDEIHLAPGRYCEAGFTITQGVTIVGSGADTTFLDGSRWAPPCVDPGVVACQDRTEEWPNQGVIAVSGGDTLISVELTDLTIENGLSDIGGGIYNEAELALDNVVVQDNCADEGGGIASWGSDVEGREDFGDLTLRDVIVRGNEAIRGAGIRTNLASVLVLDSDIVDNHAGRAGETDAFGGGIDVSGREVTLNGALIEGNRAIGEAVDELGALAQGAGLRSLGARVTLSNTTVRGNSAGSYGPNGIPTGGGLYVSGRIMTCPVDDETGVPDPDCFVEVSGNRASVGGGVFLINADDSVLRQLRVESNEATNNGGGLFVGAANIEITDGVLRGNRVVASSVPCDVEDPFCDASSANLQQAGGGLFLFFADASLERTEVSDNVAGDAAGGVAVYVSAGFTATDSQFIGNTAGIPEDGDEFGGTAGAIWVTSSNTSAFLDGCLVASNRAQERGGALSTGTAVTTAVTLIDTEVTGNMARGQADGTETWLQRGGALDIGNGTVVIRRSRLSQNESPDLGGALYIEGGTLTVEESLIDANRAITGDDRLDRFAPEGAALYAGGGTTHLINTTVSGNQSEYGGAAITNGSGSNQAVYLSFVTIADNEVIVSEAEPGGGVTATGAALNGTFSLSGVAIANNLPEACGSDVTLLAIYTLVDDESCPLTDTSVEGVDLALGELADNGGPWPTHLPAAGSPAIDFWPIGGDTCLTFFDTFVTTDQRGEPRPAELEEAGCDAGAVEVQ